MKTDISPGHGEAKQSPDLIILITQGIWKLVCRGCWYVKVRQFNKKEGMNTSLKVTDRFDWGSSTIFCKLAATIIIKTMRSYVNPHFNLVNNLNSSSQSPTYNPNVSRKINRSLNKRCFKIQVQVAQINLTIVKLTFFFFF